MLDIVMSNRFKKDLLVKFIPEDDPLPDEIEAIKEAKADMSETIPHEAINWE